MVRTAGAQRPGRFWFIPPLLNAPTVIEPYGRFWFIPPLLNAPTVIERYGRF
jgi:hypothetical protein